MPVKTDIIEGYRVTEEFGYVTEVVRRAYVNGLVISVSGQGQGLLASSGLPVPGDLHPDDANLVLGPRIPQSTAAGQGFVDLVYRTKRVIYRGGTQVSQIETATHRKTQSGGALSGQALGDVIKLNYTGSNAGIDPINPQGVDIHPYSAESTIFAELIKQTNTPGTFSQTYVNKLNSSSWQGLSAGQVLCTSGPFEPYAMTSSTKWWSFRFEFQIRDLRPPFTNAWNPEIAWRRSDGTFPSDATSANGGIAMVDWHDTVNFNTDFP